MKPFFFFKVWQWGQEKLKVVCLMVMHPYLWLFEPYTPNLAAIPLWNFSRGGWSLAFTSFKNQFAAYTTANCWQQGLTQCACGILWLTWYKKSRLSHSSTLFMWLLHSIITDVNEPLFPFEPVHMNLVQTMLYSVFSMCMLCSSSGPNVFFYCCLLLSGVVEKQNAWKDEMRSLVLIIHHIYI